MAITVAVRAHAKNLVGHTENPVGGAAATGFSEDGDQAAEPDELDDEAEDVEDEEDVDEDAADALDSDFALGVEDADAGELLDDEPRLSLR